MDTLVSKEVVADLFVGIMTKLSEKYGGEATLNEVRVVASCYHAFTYGKDASITSISNALEMPTSTVHRAVTNLIAKGWIVDKPHPEDGRKRLIALSDKGVSQGLWEYVEQLIYEHPSNNQ